MSWLTFAAMIVTGSVFSAGLMLLFKRKLKTGIALLLLAVICYIVYVYVASAYFA